MDNDPKPTPVNRAKSCFWQRGGILRMSEAVRAGIHRETLSHMVEQGELEKISRGLYRLIETPSPSNPDLAIVAAKVPAGVICLISALAFHELTTQIPHEVYVAIARNSEPPRLDYPPIRTFRFSDPSFLAGIETTHAGSVKLRVYAREKTLADCFKFRNQIGLDTCLEALRTYRLQRGFDTDAVLRYAAVCRVAQVMRPYIEAVL